MTKMPVKEEKPKTPQELTKFNPAFKHKNYKAFTTNGKLLAHFTLIIKS